MLARRQGGELLAGPGILGGGPALGFGGLVVLEPAIGIGDGLAEYVSVTGRMRAPACPGRRR